MSFSPLSKEQRNLLARVVSSARREAEAGAQEALKAFAVDHHEPFTHMSPDERALRNALRAHGRQLGDLRDAARGTQSIKRLAHEVAFEHWHRMLFARFLAENGLLVHPEHGVPVSIADCIDLAKEEGQDPWALAASFAQESLPQIFRKDDPALKIALPANRRTAIEKLVADLPRDVFIAGDSLGWCYQFWQAERKEEVNAAGNKIGADELPAVTQLFTEDYMVDFLLDNTLGAWHAGKVLATNPTLAKTAQDEDELRGAVSLPGCPWSYLRFIHGTEGKWTPAAGTFEGWPKTAQELRCLDPCMGSGHFVVAMFERLVALRMTEEGFDEQLAVAAVIRDNLFGLEIDPRCTQIGAFNLALAAWRRLGNCVLPAMNLACSGLAPNARVADWLEIAGDNEKLRNGMERLYRLFEKAAVLGSLINPRTGEGNLLEAAFHELQPLLERALTKEAKDDTKLELSVTALGLAKAAEILAGQFTLVATNVPYLGRGKQEDALQDYCERVHPDAKADLATCFVDRCLDFCAAGGSTTLVTPQTWTFLGVYAGCRRRWLTENAWTIVAKLGPAAFQDMNWWAATTLLVAIDRALPDPNRQYLALDASSTRDPLRKGPLLTGEPAKRVLQKAQLSNPDHRVLLEELESSELLEAYAEGLQGISSADLSRFIHCFWEMDKTRKPWVVLQSSFPETAVVAGREQILNLGELEQIVDEQGAAIRGRKSWGKSSVIVRHMRHLPVTLGTGEAFDANVACILPTKPEYLLPIWAFCSSEGYNAHLRKIDQKTQVTNATLVKVPFDLAHWQKMAAEKFPHGLPKPISSDPTQWLFNGHPAGSDQPLHVAAARLLGYQWPRQTGSSFPDCPALDLDGLERHADDDGIVPINPMRGELLAEERLLALLREAYSTAGFAFNQGVATKLIADTGSKATSLTKWLLNDFFEQHCKLFHHRPFIWHIWDGREDGFNVLVNYHRLAADGDGGRQLLEKLTYTYLKDWIDRQQAGVKEGTAGAEGRLAAAITLQKELKQILEGEAPYDIFVRWKPLAKQPVGWDPDINDGMRLNIRPFLLAKCVGKKGAGILRAKPNIKWDKDRGKEPATQRPKADYPWFWSCDPENNATHKTDFVGGREPTGERWNDLHYTLAVKKAARS